MASATLQQLLGAQNLSGVIQKVKPLLPDYVLPASFLTVNDTAEGAYQTYTVFAGERRAAKEVAYGAPSVTWESKGASKVQIKLSHSAHNLPIKPDLLMNLLKPDSDIKQRMAEDELSRETKNLGNAFRNKRTAVVFLALANGKVWFDATGNLLNSSSGAVQTIDYQVPLSNQGYLPVNTPEFGQAGTKIISAGWNTVGTSIATQVQSIIRASVQMTGYRVAHAFYGSNVLKYILNNTELQSYLKFNPTFNDAIRSTGQIPPGFLGLTWHPAHEAFFALNGYKSSTGEQIDVPYTVWGADAVTFCPDPADGEWYKFTEGTTPVPKTLRIARDANEAVQDGTQVAGMYSYAYQTMDPYGVTQVCGDTMLPFFGVPNAIFLANVKI